MPRSAPRALALAGLLAATPACLRIPVASFTAVSVKPIAGIAVLRESVTGRACRTRILPFAPALAFPTYERAVEDALNQVPGADALADATFYGDVRLYLFADTLCTRVEGKAVSTGGSGAAAAPSPTAP
jgi:hypothetical protein